jgi:hypothetical protein
MRNKTTRTKQSDPLAPRPLAGPANPQPRSQRSSQPGAALSPDRNNRIGGKTGLPDHFWPAAAGELLRSVQSKGKGQTQDSPEILVAQCCVRPKHVAGRCSVCGGYGDRSFICGVTSGRVMSIVAPYATYAKQQPGSASTHSRTALGSAW